MKSNSISQKLLDAALSDLYMTRFIPRRNWLARLAAWFRGLRRAIASWLCPELPYELKAAEEVIQALERRIHDGKCALGCDEEEDDE